MKKVLTIIAILQFSLFGCGQEENFDEMVNKLLSHSVPELKVMQIDSIGDVQFLDARAYREFEVSHIPEATWIGYKEFDASKVDHLAKDKPVVVYCSVGYRSEKIAEDLQDLGFTAVYNLYGGIFDWVNQGHELVNEQGPTQQIHAYNKRWGKWLKNGEKVYE